MAKSEEWTDTHIPKQDGRSAIVTGTGGLGYETALALARAGAEIILAGRNEQKGTESINKIRALVPSANIRFENIDLADLASIQAFGKRMNAQRHSLDLLINNAGVMTPPQRKVTRDGFELQLGTNYLGHFALTAHLMPLLMQGDKPRVVTVSSIAHRTGVINFDDLQSEHNYKPMAAYSQSKLACLMFALELQRRSDANGWGISSIAAHPGVSMTELFQNGTGKRNAASIALRVLGPVVFQSAAHGAWPLLYAATSKEATGGSYYGPTKLNEVRGYPAIAKVAPQAKDAAVASRLWEESERLTRTRFFND